MTRHGLRILQVITTIDIGGAELHLLALCRGLVARGHHLDVTYLKGDSTLREEFRALGIEPVKADVDRPLGPLRVINSIRRQCRRRRYALVHTHLLKANFLGAIGARLAGIRAVVASKHNDEPQLRRRWIAGLHRLSGHLDARVIHISNHIARYMIEVGGVSRARSETVHYGIDLTPSTPAPIREQYGIPETAFVIVCVARLIERKGHISLLRAFRILIDRASGPAVLLLVGKGPMEAALRAEVNELEIGDRVIFAGERQDVRAILTASDVLVLASTAEGLGLVLLEAMAASRPVVATRVGGMPELVVDGVTGVLVPPDNPGRLADALALLQIDPSRRERMGRNGREHAAREFPEERMVDRIERVYRAALDHAPLPQMLRSGHGDP